METYGTVAEGECASAGLTPNIARFLSDHLALPTPFLVLDLDVVAERYSQLRAALPAARVLPQPPRHHLLDESEILDGIDELGVLLYGHAANAYRFGSRLSIEETRALAPYQNATGLQVTSAVLAIDESEPWQFRNVLVH